MAGKSMMHKQSSRAISLSLNGQSLGMLLACRHCSLPAPVTVIGEATCPY